MRQYLTALGLASVVLTAVNITTALLAAATGWGLNTWRGAFLAFFIFEWCEDALGERRRQKRVERVLRETGYGQ